MEAISDAPSNKKAEVVDWYRRWPHAGVSVICGRISGLVVLDADPRNGNGFALIEHRLPPTPVAETGGGGCHLYFSACGLVIPKVPALLPGVGLQGEASFVVAPPSLHPSGRPYRWRPGLALGEVPLGPLPLMIRQLVAIHRKGEQAIRASSRGIGSSILTLDGVLSVLRGVRRCGRGWSAFCPAHDDRRASLSVDLDRAIFHCFGCGAVGGVKHFAELVGDDELAPQRRIPRRATTPFQETRAAVLAEARRQLGRLESFRDLVEISNFIRARFRMADSVRRLVTTLGATKTVWDALALAASVELQALAVEARVDEIVARGRIV